MGFWLAGGSKDNSDCPSPIPTLDWAFLDLDWIQDLGNGQWLVKKANVKSYVGSVKSVA